jgi:transcriptional regulator with XRE-family HTH domain
MRHLLDDAPAIATENQKLQDENQVRPPAAPAGHDPTPHSTASASVDISHINVLILNFTVSFEALISDSRFPSADGWLMITSSQLRAARALIGVDQRTLAELSDLSVPTIQRMEASDGVIRGTVDSLVKLIDALDAAGVVLIGDDAGSDHGGRGVRFKESATKAKALPRKAARSDRRRAGER